MSGIAANWQRVRAAADAAARRVGRQPDEVRIVVAAKTKSVAAIQAAIAAGARDFGENYVQEAAGKIPSLPAAPVRWHLIGHLQRNKAARAVELFDLIHTVDSSALGAALARQADRLGRVMAVLIEVNIGGEASKSGVSAAAVGELAEALRAHSALRLEGLMAIPPASAIAEESRRHFRELRQLRDRIAAATGAPLPELSMGMSDDYEVAIEEGATMVRIGRAILGDR